MNEFIKYLTGWGLVNYLIMIDYICVITIIIAINFIVKEAFVKPSLHDWINSIAMSIASLYLVFEIFYNWDLFKNCYTPIQYFLLLEYLSILFGRWIYKILM